jgi:fatty-acyl-CoA synthase
MKTIPEVLLQETHADPSRVAVYLLYNQKPDEAISYQILLRKAASTAQTLTKAGVQPGEVVILILKHEPELIHGFFGTALMGGVPSIMPFLTEKLSPDRYRESLRSLFEITQPGAVITYPEFEGQVRQAAQDVPSIKAVLTHDSIANLDEDAVGQFIPANRSPEDIALLQHSSGTTGLQKGVALSHQAIFNQIDSYAEAIRLNPNDVVVSWLPLYHDMGLIAGFLMPILSQVPLVLMSPFDWVRAPYRLMQAVSKYGGTLSWLPNFAYNFCAQKIRDRDLQGVNLSTWRGVINCSEPMHWPSQRMFLERFAPYGFREKALATSYAMAENVFAVTQGGIDSPVQVDMINRETLLESQIAQPDAREAHALKMLSAGRPLSNTRVRVIAPDGQNMPDRYVGEISIQSDCMLTAYYNRPDLTEKAFLDGWYLTGDLGYMAEGELYITGRKKDLIIVGGKNIYPQDLEHIAGEVPGVHPGRVVAFGIFNERMGTEDVVILAESDAEDPAEKGAIADMIRNQVTLNSDVALRYVEVVERGWLLKTSSGKIARSANRGKYLQRH